jgi:hypothetical protein
MPEGSQGGRGSLILLPFRIIDLPPSYRKVAARLTKIEKTILQDSLEGLRRASGAELPAPAAAAAALAASPIKFS